MDSPKHKTTKVGDEVRRRLKVNKEPFIVICVSLLRALTIIVSYCIACATVVLVLCYNNYHHEQCARHEPGSQLVIGNVLITQLCPFPIQVMEKALVESFSDEVPDA